MKYEKKPDHSDKDIQARQADRNKKETKSKKNIQSRKTNTKTRTYIYIYIYRENLIRQQ